MSDITLVQTRVGTPKKIGKDRRDRPVFSSIARKRVWARAIWVTPTGLAGDQPTDTKPNSDGNGQMHGGYDKAVYAFPVEHYRSWRKIIGWWKLLFRSFGENLRVRGITEENVHIGDIWEIGDVKFRVTKPRKPCKTLEIYFGEKLIKAMFNNGLCGWYLEVITTGLMPTSGPIRHIGSQANAPTVSEVLASMRNN